MSVRTSQVRTSVGTQDVIFNGLHHGRMVRWNTVERASDQDPQRTASGLLGAIFGSSHFGSNLALLSRVEELALVSLVLTLARPPFVRTGHSCKIDGSFQAMGSRRRGFQGSVAAVVARTTPTFSQVACGATAKAQCVSRQRQPARQASQDPAWDVGVRPPTNRTPEVVAEATAEEVLRLENAVAALGANSHHAKPLMAALKAAKAKLNVPISVQIESTEHYLERARKRLQHADEEVAKAIAKRNECSST